MQLASNDYATANDLMKNKIQLLNEELVTHRKSSQQLEALQQQRDHEIRAVLAMSTVFEKRISVLQCSTAQVRRLYKESQESNKQVLLYDVTIISAALTVFLCNVCHSWRKKMRDCAV